VKVWFYVEGQSDVNALLALFANWCDRMRNKGWGIQVIPLRNKSEYFRKLGARAAEKLLADQGDLVVGLPDYYPNLPYRGGQFQHDTFDALIQLQERLLAQTLQRQSAGNSPFMSRFHASALKHDLEMLLLAAEDPLIARLGQGVNLARWKRPVEDQNQKDPPKRVIEGLFFEKTGRAYRDTIDAPAVLGRVANMKTLLFNSSGQPQCPVFKAMLVPGDIRRYGLGVL